MTTTSFGDVDATGDDRRPSGESNVAGQPPITSGSGLLSTDWLPGPNRNRSARRRRPCDRTSFNPDAPTHSDVDHL
jgi:hypothetical protein